MNMEKDETILSVRHAKKDFVIGNEIVNVLGDINLEIKKGEFVSIVGSSGCGKSTLLKLITSLENLTDGEILIENEPVMGYLKNVV